MKTYQAVLLRFVTAFFCIFGILQLLFFFRNEILSYGLRGIDMPDTLLCLCSALVLSVSHTFISWDSLDNKFSVKARLIICGIPCIFVSGVFAHKYNIPSHIREWFGIDNKEMAIISWYIGLVLCAAVFALAYFAIEWRYYRIGKKYDAALAKYKKEKDGEE